MPLSMPPNPDVRWLLPGRLADGRQAGSWLAAAVGAAAGGGASGSTTPMHLKEIIVLKQVARSGVAGALKPRPNGAGCHGRPKRAGDVR